MGFFWSFAEDGLEKAFSKLSSVLPQCKSFESSALHFELARVHNRMDYSLNENRGIHYLTPTTLKLAPNCEQTPKLFMPVVCSHEKAPSAKKAGLSVYYLETAYPYSVLEATSERKLSGGRVVYLKTSGP
jgi:hypothetical protein